MCTQEISDLKDYQHGHSGLSFICSRYISWAKPFVFINIVMPMKDFPNLYHISPLRSFLQKGESPEVMEIVLFLTFSRIYLQGVPKKHGNSVTNSISSLFWISIAIPNFKSHNIIMSARVYFMKRVKNCKDVSIMSPQDEQWRRTSLLCLYTAIFLFY